MNEVQTIEPAPSQARLDFAPLQPLSTLKMPTQAVPPYIELANGKLYIDRKDWGKTEYTRKLIDPKDLERYLDRNVCKVKDTCVVYSGPETEFIGIESISNWVLENSRRLHRPSRHRLHGAAADTHKRRMERERTERERRRAQGATDGGGECD